MDRPTPDASSAARVNQEYYATLTRGRNDYWRKMAAPRYRVATFMRLIGQLRPRTLVDLGCGNGLLLEEIRRSRPGLELAGIDLSAPQIADNQARLPGLTWQALDLEDPGHAERLPGRYEAVVASEIIEHLDRPEAFLRNALALAVPGCGRLLLSTQSGPLRETERRVGHRRHYAAHEMDDLLRRTGWEPERVWNCGWPFHDLSKWWANRNPDASMGRFGDRPYGPYENLVCFVLRLLFRCCSRTRGAQLFAVARRSAPSAEAAPARTAAPAPRNGRP